MRSSVCHRRSHHLTGDLRASARAPSKRSPETGAGTGASDSLVRLGLVDGTSEIDGACHWNICLPLSPIVIFEAFGSLRYCSSVAFEAIEYPWQPRLYLSGHFSMTGQLGQAS